MADAAPRLLAPALPHTPAKNSARRGPVSPELGSAPGWPLVVYFHHVRRDLQHYTVLSPEDFTFALELLGRHFRPFDPTLLEDPPGTWPDEPTCLVTFDDGYCDVYEHAAPALEERGWRAVMFVSSEQVGAVEEHPRRGPIEHMSWDHLRDLHRRGYVVASHGATHRDMSLLSADEVKYEVAASQYALALEVGRSPGLLAFPFGNEPGALEELSGALPRFCFGSVKAAPAPWSVRPQSIRRTYLPTGETWRWEELVDGWRRQWTSSA